MTAERLGLCLSIEHVKHELQSTDALVAEAGDAPADFWSRLADAYEGAPKPLNEESGAAAALNALVISARALILAHKRRGA